MNKHVLIVTPVFSTEQNARLPLLLQTIASVQQQAQPHTHVIVNDGSTDSTADTLDALAKENNLLVYHTANQGPAAAVNHGVREALEVVAADYITVCHSDDLLTRNSLSARVQAAQSPFVYSDLALFYTDGRAPVRYTAPSFRSADALAHALLQSKSIPFQTMFWERHFFEAVGGYDAQLHYGEDWEIAIRSAQALHVRGESATVLPDVTVLYRWHEHNHSHEKIAAGWDRKATSIVLGKNTSGFASLQYRLHAALYHARARLPESIKTRLRARVGTSSIEDFSYN
jgi:glycosyltransferase involved in cell wall biosynthesis